MKSYDLSAIEIILRAVKPQAVRGGTEYDSAKSHWTEALTGTEHTPVILSNEIFHTFCFVYIESASYSIEQLEQKRGIK